MPMWTIPDADERLSDNLNARHCMIFSPKWQPKIRDYDHHTSNTLLKFKWSILLLLCQYSTTGTGQCFIAILSTPKFSEHQNISNLLQIGDLTQWGYKNIKNVSTDFCWFLVESRLRSVEILYEGMKSYFYNIEIRLGGANSFPCFPSLNYYLLESLGAVCGYEVLFWEIRSILMPTSGHGSHRSHGDTSESWWWCTMTTF
jgi:hypothetical protein